MGVANRWVVWFRSVGVRAAVMMVALVMVSTAMAQITVPRVRAGPTGLTSDNERMISYRHQDHLWQTADGALHLVINRSTQEPWLGLALFSSLDGGVNWVFQRSFANTDRVSLADGFLRGVDLAVAYQAVDGNVIFTQLRYDAGTRAGSEWLAETAYASPVLGAINPAVAVDEQGTIWCAFVARDRVTGDLNVRIVARVSGTSAWLDTGQVFGPTDRMSIERSARPVPIPGGMGLLYTVRENSYWATRDNAMPTESAWNGGLLFTRSPVPRLADPYASHFSVVADPSGNLHLAINDNFDVLYLKWSAATAQWPVAKQVDDTRKVVYMQMGSATTSW